MTATKYGDVRDVDDPPGVDNPMWEAVRHLPGSDLPSAWPWEPGRRWEPESYPIGPDRSIRRSRYEVCRDYAWAVTDPVSVAFVAEHAGPRVIEVGAGAGYWAYQLSQRGIDVLAYDQDPPDVRPNHWHSPGQTDQGEPKGLRSTWHLVQPADAAVAAAMHGGRTLLICWPPYSDPMAADVLRCYSGDRLIYIGEGPGGCTGDDDFHRLLGHAGWDEDAPDPGSEWMEVADHRPVQWWGIHDRITVYQRKARKP